MKKVLALILSLTLVLSMITPINSFAQGVDKELEQAIKVAKAALDIPEDFTEFNYYVYGYGNEKVWELTWRNKQKEDNAISASVNQDGILMNYYRHKPYTQPNKKFPATTMDEAREAAEKFLNKIDSKLVSQLSYNEQNYDSLSNTIYNINYFRMVNGIPFHHNNVYLGVDKETGEVISFNRNWSNQFVFPEAKNYITLEEAQEAYVNELGLNLVYRFAYNYQADEYRVYLAYVPKYSTNYGIDAFTGQKVEFSPYFYYDDMRYGMTMDSAKYQMEAGGAVNLSPEELKAIEEVSKLISREEAEKIARDSKILGIDSKFKLSSIHLNRSWPFKKNFDYNLYFEFNQEKEGRVHYNYVSVTMDAVTGKIKAFYTHDNRYNPDEKGKVDIAHAKAEVENFLKEFFPEQFEQVKLDENHVSYYGPMPKDPVEFNFRFIRQVNGISFESNAITVSYDAVNQKIRGFNISWYDINFEEPANLLGLEKANKVLFDKIGLDLIYRPVINNYIGIPKPLDEQQAQKLETKLVYNLKMGKSYVIDAKTGEILDYDGKPIKEVTKIKYNDIEGHYAEKQIQTLAEYNIGFRQEQFNPDQEITQSDFFLLFANTLDYYMPYHIDDNYIKNIYNQLIRQGILKENERAEKSIVVKEDAVKYIIRALGHEEVAVINGIYNCPFEDVIAQSPENIGYITLAHGLGIVNGYQGKFNPKSNLTRAQAAVIIYNYLNR